ncbi:DNA-binding response regulator [Paramixta manurensis]|uniref:DNA-binding response regulator n=1 Tax=Paramixta manurensis TaxID=2740817 RepID=A0A6M8UEG6_9GAMM|nr:DNA-binding response regulator [Erwiniaceae bacterium PD-1]
MENPHFTVIVVDDHPLMRRGIRQLLALDARFEVVAEASNGSEALVEVQRLMPDLILLDLNMKGISGLDTLKALRDDQVTSRVLVLTVSDARNDIYAMVDAGADGYLLKDSEPEQLLAQIIEGAQGQNVFSEIVSDYLAGRTQRADPFSTLTDRERDVLQEVARGLSNKGIAAVLSISEETVKVHIRNLLRKLDVRSRVAATVLWLENKHT